MITYPKRIDLIKSMPAGSIGCEVGVWRGYLSIEILNETNVGKLFLVDAWKNQGDSYPDNLSLGDHEENLRQTKHHVRGHMRGGRVEIIRGMSVDVAENYKTVPMLDWVYIDADHTFKACLADLIAWSKRIKTGGCIMGHDYTHDGYAATHQYGVIEAVTEFCAKYGWELVALTDENYASFCLRRRKGMIPRIIHQCFLQPPMPEKFERYVRELKTMNPSFRHIMWTMENYQELGLSKRDLPFTNPVWNSDIIRLHAVWQMGGIYLDCDFESLKPLDPLLNYSAFSALQPDGQVNNGIFGAKPEHQWVKWQIDHLHEYIPKRREWGVLLSTEAPRDGLTLIPPHWVYPFGPYAKPEERIAHPESIVVHQWEGSWTK